MPIYDYKCRRCGHCFEAFVRPRASDAAACPACQSPDLEQLVSGFAVSTEERSKSAFGTARKQTEKNLREERIGRQEEWQDHH